MPWWWWILLFLLFFTAVGSIPFWPETKKWESAPVLAGWIFLALFFIVMIAGNLLAPLS